ncbi:MAG: PDZ domain-containing protein [Verrucomicrobiota bacterium]
MIVRSTLSLAALALVLLAGPAPGQEEKPAAAETSEPDGGKPLAAAPGEQAPDGGKAAPPAPSREELGAYFEQLASDDFRARQEARSTLTELMLAHPEVCLDPMFGRILEGKDPEVRHALKEVLFTHSKERFHRRSQGFLGIQMSNGRIFDQKTRKAINTVTVQMVIPKSAAAANGLRVGDQIQAIDGNDFTKKTSPRDYFASYVRAKAAGEPIVLGIKRGGKDIEIKVSLGQRPRNLNGGLQDEAQEETYFEQWFAEEVGKRKTQKP